MHICPRPNCHGTLEAYQPDKWRPVVQRCMLCGREFDVMGNELRGLPAPALHGDNGRRHNSDHPMTGHSKCSYWRVK